MGVGCGVAVTFGHLVLIQHESHRDKWRIHQYIGTCELVSLIANFGSLRNTYETSCKVNMLVDMISCRWMHTRTQTLLYLSSSFSASSDEDRWKPITIILQFIRPWRVYPIATSPQLPNQDLPSRATDSSVFHRMICFWIDDLLWYLEGVQHIILLEMLEHLLDLRSK